MKTRYTMRMMKRLLIMTVAIVLVSTSTEGRIPTNSEQQTIGTAILKTMRDPTSQVQIGWSDYWMEDPMPDGIMSYCLLVNGRNEFGGWTGLQPYLVFLTWKDGRLIKVSAFGTIRPTHDDCLGLPADKKEERSRLNGD